jgi:hypothetical protein
MGHRVGMAIVCLHISAVLYLLVGFGFLLFALFFGERTIEMWIFTTFIHLFCVALVVGIEFVFSGLKHRKFWAWVAGLCIFAMYLPSAFLPLGAFGMWGLLDAGSQREFFPQRSPPTPPPTA